MKGFGFFLAFLALFIHECSSQGAPWTEDETKIIYQKIKQLCKYSGINAYKNIHPGYNTTFFQAGHVKMLRLAFHDCLPYHGPLNPGEISGCDGCLEPTGMNTHQYRDFPYGAAPKVNLTNNNGLTFMADLLEEVYTNASFPWDTPSLNISMKESGKSRADLWAFAGLVAYEHGIEKNNEDCASGRHIRENDPDCKINWPQIPQFKTGRKDCVPDANATKPWHASSANHEVHPSPMFNGPMTTDFFKKNFGLDSRETIAIVSGSHSLGRMHPDISGGFRYAWTHSFADNFNNQVLRQISQRPSYRAHNWGQYKWGDCQGNPANTSWVLSGGFGPSIGRVRLWFHNYYLCGPKIECTQPQTETGILNCPTNGTEKWIGFQETALGSDVGFYQKFKVQAGSLAPYGCTNAKTGEYLDKPNPVWKWWIPMQCDKEDYAPDGEPLYAIVDEMADNQSSFIKTYIKAYEKMTANGYNPADLTAVPTTWFPHPISN